MLGLLDDDCATALIVGGQLLYVAGTRASVCLPHMYILDKISRIRLHFGRRQHVDWWAKPSTGEERISELGRPGDSQLMG